MKTLTGLGEPGELCGFDEVVRSLLPTRCRLTDEAISEVGRFFYAIGKFVGNVSAAALVTLFPGVLGLFWEEGKPCSNDGPGCPYGILSWTVSWDAAEMGLSGLPRVDSPCSIPKCGFIGMDWTIGYHVRFDICLALCGRVDGVDSFDSHVSWVCLLPLVQLSLHLIPCGRKGHVRESSALHHMFVNRPDQHTALLRILVFVPQRLERLAHLNSRLREIDHVFQEITFGRWSRELVGVPFSVWPQSFKFLKTFLCTSFLPLMPLLLG